MAVPYGKGEGDIGGFIKHPRFTLNGENFMVMDKEKAARVTQAFLKMKKFNIAELERAAQGL